MIYAYDKAAQFPVAELYDTLMMAMAINAAKDMYEKGQDEIKDFTKTYGDFMSPFAKDMERYGEMVGGVRDTINRMYAAGIDPLRSAEGRAMLSRLTNSINPAEFNMMRANAKTGYAYLDAILDLRRKGKYSEAQELFDIMQTGGLGTDSEGNSINTFENFSTAGRGGWNSFTRTSPIEAATLQELTKSGYEGRAARLLSAADFNDPRLKGYTYDPNYEWSGYLYSDLLKGAPGAVMSASADPRMAYFRNLAEQKVAASGLPYTLADVEAQLLRDVADANTWALIDPTRKANEFALDDHRRKNDEKLAWSREAALAYYGMLPEADLDGDGKLSKEERSLYAMSKQSGNGQGSTTQGGWNMLEDVYATSIAQSNGIELLPKNGISAWQLTDLVKKANIKQNQKIRETGDILKATGSYIAREKLGGIIPSDGKNGRGYFLNTDYIDDLLTLDETKMSYVDWGASGKTLKESNDIKSEAHKKGDAIRTAIKNHLKNGDASKGKLKVVVVSDENGNNTYNFIGDDNKWHTHARVKVYMSDGKNSTFNVKASEGDDETYAIPQGGLEMTLNVGLHSNENSGTPDLSVNARERYGFYGYDATKKKIGTEGNTGWMYGNNVISSDNVLYPWASYAKK